MSDRCAYVIVPFERRGTRLVARRALVVEEVGQARWLARGLSRRVPGVAVLERRIDPETGDDTDTLIAGLGAIPPRFPHGADWTLRLS